MHYFDRSIVLVIDDYCEPRGWNPITELDTEGMVHLLILPSSAHIPDRRDFGMPRIEALN